MAGTRLLLTCVALGQLLALVGVAFYVGLQCGGHRSSSCDLACSKLSSWLFFFMKPQAGRALLETDAVERRLQELEQPVVSVWPSPPIVVMAAKSRHQAWQTTIHELQVPGDRIVVRAVDDDALRRQCGEDESITSDYPAAHVWICDAVSKEPSTVVRSDGSLWWYPQPQQADWQTIYPTTSSSQKHTTRNLDVTVVLDRAVSTKSAWRNRVYQWLTTAQVNDWPFWDQYRLEFQTSADLGNKVKPHLANDNLTYYYEMDVNDAVPVFIESASDTAAWRVVLYIPSLVPLTLVSQNDSSKVLSAGDSCWFAVLDEATGQAVLDELLKVLLVHFLRIPQTVVEQAMTLPKLYWDLWHQRRTQSLYVEAVSALISERQRLRQAHWSVVVTESTARVWIDASDRIANKNSSKNNKNSQLQDALKLLTALHRDPSLAEPLDLSRDHYAGVFVPLLFPMLVPLLLGMVREYRRYREHKRKKNKRSDQEKEKQD